MMSKTNPSLSIHGSIFRNCERCGKPSQCNCFEISGKSHTMCAGCTFEEFDHGKPDLEGSMKDCDICKKCNLMTMRLEKELTEITNEHVIKHFQCAKCGERKTSKVKKWRKPRGKNNGRRTTNNR